MRLIRNFNIPINREMLFSLLFSNKNKIKNLKKIVLAAIILFLLALPGVSLAKTKWQSLLEKNNVPQSLLAEISSQSEPRGIPKSNQKLSKRAKSGRQQRMGTALTIDRRKISASGEFRKNRPRAASLAQKKPIGFEPL